MCVVTFVGRADSSAPYEHIHTYIYIYLFTHPPQQQPQASTLNVSALLTSWVGYGLNFLRYRLSMDNSLAGSRSNISAHYDIGNDLYTLMLDRCVLLKGEREGACACMCTCMYV